MTDQSPNDQFHASSFLQGHNADYLEQLYARYATDPNAVDEAWRSSSASSATPRWTPSARRPARPGRGADWPPVPDDDLTAALDGQWAEPAKAAEKIRAKAAEKGVGDLRRAGPAAVLDSIRALMIIRAYRIRGHLAADLDPLGMRDEKRRTPSSTRAPTASPRPTWTGRSSSTTCSGLEIASMRADPRHREAHLLRHLRAAVHAHLRPRAGRLAEGADRGLRQGNRLHPRGRARRS